MEYNPSLQLTPKSDRNYQKLNEKRVRHPDKSVHYEKEIVLDLLIEIDRGIFDWRELLNGARWLITAGPTLISNDDEIASWSAALTFVHLSWLPHHRR